MHYKQEAPTLAQTAKKERLFSLAEKNAFKILKDQKREVKYVFTANNRFQYFQKPLFSIFIPPSSINNDKKEGREEKKNLFHTNQRSHIYVHAEAGVRENITLQHLSTLRYYSEPPLYLAYFSPSYTLLVFPPTHYYLTDPLLRKKGSNYSRRTDFSRPREQKFPLAISLHPITIQQQLFFFFPNISNYSSSPFPLNDLTRIFIHYV